ncbi:superinfection immunity protein [Streptomyces sp. NPDC059385]|uniref:superinfection immunity protein n=1 Tax=Streptomyces sp. NPDC059385 TaxID=3346817 RepID=UPI0036A912B4
MSVRMALIVLALYFVPTIIAIPRNIPNRGSVVVINIFLGWTVIGWVIALAMAARSATPHPGN